MVAFPYTLISCVFYYLRSSPSEVSPPLLPLMGPFSVDPVSLVPEGRVTDSKERNALWKGRKWAQKIPYESRNLVLVHFRGSEGSDFGTYSWWAGTTQSGSSSTGPHWAVLSFALPLFACGLWKSQLLWGSTLQTFPDRGILICSWTVYHEAKDEKAYKWRPCVIITFQTHWRAEARNVMHFPDMT